MLPKGQLSLHTRRDLPTASPSVGKLPLTYLSMLFSLLPHLPRLQPWEGYGKIPGETRDIEEPTTQIKGELESDKGF